MCRHKQMKAFIDNIVSVSNILNSLNIGVYCPKNSCRDPLLLDCSQTHTAGYHFTRVIAVTASLPPKAARQP